MLRANKLVGRVLSLLSPHEHAQSIDPTMLFPNFPSLAHLGLLNSMSTQGTRLNLSDLLFTHLSVWNIEHMKAIGEPKPCGILDRC